MTANTINLYLRHAFHANCIIAATILSLCSAPGDARAEDKFPQSWHKTMTGDPSTNFYLQKFSKSLGNPAADTLRNVMLSLALNHYCDGNLALNAEAANTYLSTSGYFNIKGKSWDDASFTAVHEFNGFDYHDVAHLCAGIDYLFGKQGILVKNLLSPGAGEPKEAYDPANPYLRVPALKKPPE
jgi:hypothetical protein